MDNAYKKAGVNVEAGYESVELIKKHIAQTANRGTMGTIGSFGALFDLSKYDYREPVLVSGSDGVGTKVELASALGTYDSIGIDLVAMCVNDIVAMKAKPLFFLDYIAVAQNVPQQIESIVKGICTGLKQCDCALSGGETAEMPGVYQPKGFDLAGFCVGIIEKKDLAVKSAIKAGQVLIGIPASGVHANGYSLVRKIIKEAKLDLNKKYRELSTEQTLGEILLTPTRIYVNEILNLLKEIDLKGIAHITGGGFYENIARIDAEYGYEIEAKKINVLPIFKFLEAKGQLKRQEMFGYFNMGIGMVIVVAQEDVEAALSIIKDSYIIGKTTKGKGVIIC